MARLDIIGERIHCIAPSIRKAFDEMNPEIEKMFGVTK